MVSAVPAGRVDRLACRLHHRFRVGAVATANSVGVTTLGVVVAGFVRKRRQQGINALQDATQNFGEFGTAPDRLALVLLVG